MTYAVGRDVRVSSAPAADVGMSSRPSSTPLVSIGIPAFNGGRFVRASLQSIVDQDYPSLEILISDDGSADDSAEICEEFARRDPRITVIRQAHVGERRNFNTVLQLARGGYFMWAADHDLWDRRYVSSCVAALESDPRAVLAYAHTMLIDEDDHDLGIMDDELGIYHGRAVERYTTLIWRLTRCNAIYGLMRREAVVRTGGYGPTPGPDHLVLAKMALQGTFIQLPEVMYFRRQNRPVETPEEQRRRQSLDLDPSIGKMWVSMPKRRYYRGLRDGHLRAVLQAPIPPRDKARGIAATLACFSARFGVGSRPLRTARHAARLLPSALRARIAGRP